MLLCVCVCACVRADGRAGGRVCVCLCLFLASVPRVPCIGLWSEIVAYPSL